MYKRRSAVHAHAELQKDVVDSERERQKTSCSSSENTPSFNTLEKKKKKSCTVQTMMMMTTTTTTHIITEKQKTRTRETAKQAILQQLHRRQAAIYNAPRLKFLQKNSSHSHSQYTLCTAIQRMAFIKLHHTRPLLECLPTTASSSHG
jgi:hypothetical protein